MANELDLMSTLPPDVYQQQQALNRQQQMAATLMAQNQQPQGQIISGHYVAPSFFQNLQPVANMLTGAYLQNKGDEKALALAKQIREGREAEKQAAVELIKANKPVDILGLGNDYGGVTPFISAATKVALPEPTVLEREYNAAKSQGYKGTINQFKNQMNDAERARIGLQAQQQAWDMGMPIGGVGGGVPSAQAPLRTINPGSPILAPNQVMPGQMPQGQMPMVQPGQMPRFTSKPEQELWLANQKEKGKLQVEAQNALPAALQTAEMGLTTINKLIGDTTVDAKGNVVYGKQEPHPGFHGAVGIPGIQSGFGVAGLIPGTDTTDFKNKFKQLEGQAFLQAINSLRGTGAISEREGASATAAITDMALSQSEKAFVESANQLKSILQKGYQNAQQKAGVTPINYNAQPSGGTQPKLKYNLQTGQWE